MTKHTPGPWELVNPGDMYIGSSWAVRAKTPEGPGYPTPNATGHYCIASPPPHGKDKAAEQEANARLISAAPELLEALEEAEEYFDQRADAEYFTDSAQPVPNEEMRLLTLIRAAIAKARRQT